MRLILFLLAALVLRPSVLWSQAFSTPSTNSNGSVLAFTVAGGLRAEGDASYRAASSSGTPALRWKASGTVHRRISDDGKRAYTYSQFTRLGNRPGCVGGSSCLTAVTDYFHTITDYTNPDVPRTVWTADKLAVKSAWMNPNGKDVAWESLSGQLLVTKLDGFPATTELVSSELWEKIERLDDGSFFVSGGAPKRRGFLAVNGKFTDLGTAVPDGAVVSGDGSKLFHVVGGDSLRVTDRRSGQTSEFYKATGSISGLQISRDGSVVVFAMAPTGPLPGDPSLMLVTARGAKPLLEGEAVTSYTLSADGRVAYCVTVRGRIVRLDIDPQAMTVAQNEIVPRTPVIEAFLPSLSPCSQVLILGTGLADREQSVPIGEPWTQELDGIQVGSSRMQLAIGSVSPTMIRAQVPCDAPLSNESDLFTIASQSPFRQSTPGYIQTVVVSLLSANFGETARQAVYDAEKHPAIYRATDPPTLLEKKLPDGGFGPVKAEERLHLMMTGLGAVSPAVETGAIAPSDPPAAAIVKPQCRLGWEAEVEVPVEYAGLEPGSVGVYRVTVRLPEVLVAGPLRCGAGSRGGASWRPDFGVLLEQ